MTFNLLLINLYKDCKGIGIFGFRNWEKEKEPRCLFAFEINHDGVEPYYYLSILFFNFEF